jgi:glutamate-5-semialdehyde dehydrogenase
MVKRLALSNGKLRSLASALEQIAVMPDILGEVIEVFQRPNGLVIRKVRVPFGVVGITGCSRSSRSPPPVRPDG